MPTAARLIYDGAACHIMQGGNSDAGRQRSYEQYVLAERMYEYSIDKEFKIKY